MRRSLCSLALVVCLGSVLKLAAQQPGAGPIQQTGSLRFHDATRDCGTKVCAVEMKATTKVVHGSACKDYCQPPCSLAGLFQSCFGGKCPSCDCGTVKTARVLTKKVVPGPDVPVCKVKNVAECVPVGVVEVKKTP